MVVKSDGVVTCILHKVCKYRSSCVCRCVFACALACRGHRGEMGNGQKLLDPPPPPGCSEHRDIDSGEPELGS
jgi:hypothetical protein